MGAMLAFGQDDYLGRARKLATQYIGIDSHIDTAQRVFWTART